MWPWAHLAVGYLLYTALVWYRGHRVPTDLSALALALGTQAPDLIDKPLAWYLPILPGGRSLAHSLFAVAVVLTGTVAVRRYRARAGPWVAFAVGYATHPLADAVDPIYFDAYEDLSFLLWPLTSIPAKETGGGLAAVITRTELTSLFAGQILLTALALSVWVSQGRPGLAPIRDWLHGHLVAS